MSKIYFNWRKIGMISAFLVPAALLALWLTNWEWVIWNLK